MRIKHNDALHTAALHTADELGIKPSRIAAAIRAEQAERLLREDEQAERSTRKTKRGVQAERGRTRVDRAREVEEVESLATYGSWGYVGPRGVVSNVRDDLTVGVVDGTGAMSEAKDLPVYQFRYVDDGRNYYVCRDFGLALARRWARRYAKAIAEAQGASVWVDEKHDCLTMIWENDQQEVAFGHIRSKSQLRELICK